MQRKVESDSKTLIENEAKRMKNMGGRDISEIDKENNANTNGEGGGGGDGWGDAWDNDEEEEVGILSDKDESKMQVLSERAK